MPDVQNILSGAPAQIAIYDSTNGLLCLGYLSSKNFQLTAKPLFHTNINGNRYQYGTRTILKVEMLESDPTKLAALKAKHNDKQDIYTTAAEYGVKLHDCYVQYGQKRKYGPGDVSVIQITAYTDVEDDVEVIKNLLSRVPATAYDYGNFNTDTNSDGLADGWTAVGTIADGLTDPSWLNGAGDSHQELGLDNTELIYCDITWYLDQPVLITFSANIKGGVTPYTHQVTLRIRILRSGNNSVDHKAYSFEINDLNSGRYSVSQMLNPGSHDIVELRCEIGSDHIDGATIEVDDAQLEFGSLSDYTEND
jgi:hypothetical protein